MRFGNKCLLLLAVTSLCAADPARAADATANEPSKPPVTAATPIVCLHTEFYPIKHEALKFRLMRELGRQAVLITARDELGLATRDETLDEVFPDSVKQAKQDVFVAVRSQYNGDVNIQLWPASQPQEPQPVKKIMKYVLNSIQTQTETVAKMIPGELREKLRSLGFEGKVVPANEKNLPPYEIEDHLLDINFVSQFAAVRAAHKAIAEKGSSRAWLGVLARGYANLALTTEHHWKSDTEVFAARALLYAQRLTTTYPNDPIAHATRAYVCALVGLHTQALEELARAEELHKQDPQPALPGWVEVIKPYCTFEREALSTVAQRRPSLRQLAQRLSFQQHRAFGDDDWMFESAKQTISVCPEEYGVYAALTVGNKPLSVGRTGAYYAPAALAHYLPRRIAQLEGLPKNMRDGGKGASNTEKDAQSKNGEENKKPDLEQIAEAPELPIDYAADTVPIVDVLRAATRSGDDHGEPSWSALGELIFEEQFVQAANYLHIAMNATESSHEADVKSIMPAIKGHRYAQYIESYGVNASREQTRFNEIIGNMRVVDTRGNMWPMMVRLWNINCNPTSYGRGSDAAWAALIDRGITFNGMIEAYDACGDRFWNQVEPATHTRWSNDFNALSPHSPQALRFAMVLVDKPTYEQATQWEAQAGEDPTAYLSLGGTYFELKNYEDAIRMFERSIALSPTKEAFVGLATTYRAAGQESMWQPTLERFLEGGTVGLAQASVHSMIANDLMDRGKFDEAKPHAVAAAETWSGWGLQIASEVDEALGHWEESEKWIAEMARNYPTSSGYEWYFWCRRTGRGNANQARKLIDEYLKAESIKTNMNGQLNLMTFHLLENDPRAAYEEAKQAAALAAQGRKSDDDMVYQHLHVALLARELKDAEGADAAIKETRRLSEKFRAQYGPFSNVNIAVCDILDGKPPSDEARAKIDHALENDLNKISRCNYQYFLGRAYDLAGNKELAEKYWKPCVTRGPFGRYNATLAGKYLCDLHETSRQ